ncbi:FRG domain-containing protein [Paenibacillus sp. NPDC057886]|uniref:FRG domain-containing protein n=1 Tax=Paenibacillus sp. NPDC057886 TaxID=3346270 RepID=UPI0036B15389
MTDIKVYEIESLSELLSVTEKLGKDFKCNIDEIWYRGVSREKYKLIPGHYRNIVDEQYEESIIQDFLTNYIMYSDIKSSNHLELYSLMQHYGLPTRLLDWSKSPLVACYFALSSLKLEDQDDHRVIWAINPAELNRISIGEYRTIDLDINLHEIARYEERKGVIAINPSFSNRRVIAQKGHFTIHFDEHSVEEYFENRSNDIVKIIISRDEIKAFNMRRHLYALGYKEDDIYQDLDSMAKRIIRERKKPVDVLLEQVPSSYFKE